MTAKKIFDVLLFRFIRLHLRARLMISLTGRARGVKDVRIAFLICSRLSITYHGVFFIPAVQGNRGGGFKA